MKFILFQKKEGKDKGKWSWTLTTHSGAVLSTAARAHADKEKCLQELSDIKEAAAATKVIAVK